jgi:hypothetical protein
VSTIAHVTDALARLGEQFKSQPNLVAFLTAHVAPLQDIEDALQQLLLERQVDTAIGDQLDALGALVGQARAGLSDDNYRRYVRARIMANRSKAIVEDLLQVARLILDEDDAVIRIKTWGVAAYDITVEDVVVSDALAGILLAFLQDATGGAVRVRLNYSPTDPAENLIFDSTDAAQFWDAGTWASTTA